MLPTIAWQGEDIVMVDQRKLPATEIYVTCKSVNDVAKAIKTMVIRGAPAIGVSAAMGIALGMSKSKASGTKISEDYIKHAVAFAYDAKSPQTAELAREWVAAYPTPKNWRDAIKVYTALSPASDSELIDIYRLQRATGALAGEGDYGRFAATLDSKGLVGEAKAVIEEGYRNGLARSSNMSALLGQASAKVAADKASLASGATKALAGSSAKPLLTTGDAFYGYGDYAKAAELYRAALGKADVDAGQANLRLGTALTMSGDKAGAKVALEAVTGAKADIAKYWLVYLAQRP